MRRELNLWLSLHPAAVLAPVAMLVLGLFAVIALPIGPPERLTGALERIVYVGRGAGRPHGWVRLRDGTLVTVGLDDRFSCAEGGSIRLYRQRHIWGRGYAAESVPCGVRPTQ